MERLVLALPDDRGAEAPPRAFVVAIGAEARPEALMLLRELRRAGVPALMEFDARGVKAQMKRADRVAARVTLLVGGDELARGEVTVRDMRAGEQRAVARSDVVRVVRQIGDLA
jgi:histidyl-tRNA synthetase